MKLLAVFILFLSMSAQALQFEKVIADLTLPWGMAFIHPQQILITEKLGDMKVLDLSQKKTFKVTGKVGSAEYGQGGLLDVALDSQFKKNGKIYFSYTKEVSGKYTTALGTAQLVSKNPESYELQNIQELFVAVPAQSEAIHFGSRLAITDSEIWMTVGDRGNRDLAQDLSAHMGKVLKLDKKGKAHSSNPFLKDPKAKPEIWSYGHRNPQGMFLNTKTNELWVNEHGPRGGDELNLIKRGANYGWPVVTHGREYSGEEITPLTEKPGIEKSVHFYVPSIAPCGMTYYTGDQLPELKDSFLIGALALTHLNQVKVVDGKFVFEKKLFENKGLRIRDVESGPDGLVYFMTDSGDLYRVKN
jgi:aldose sugar dehydrogenase